MMLDSSSGLSAPACEVEIDSDLIPNFFDDRDISLPELLQRTVNQIATAWQHPEVVSVRIKYADQEFKTVDFQKHPQKISREILVQEKPAGLLEVYCPLADPPTPPSSCVSKNQGLVTDIAQRLGAILEQKKMHREFWLEAQINAAIARVAKTLITSASIEEISILFIQEAQRLTNSTYGYACYLEPRTGRLTPVCQALHRDQPPRDAIADRVNPQEFDQLCELVRQDRKPFLTNSPHKHITTASDSDEFVPIQCFLSYPARFDKKMVGQIALANAPQKYNFQEMRVLERLSDFYSIAIQRKFSDDALNRSRQELKRHKKELKKQVNERTQELRDTNLLLQNEIEERRQTEIALENSKAKFQEMFNEMNCAVILFKPEKAGSDFVAVDLNHAARELDGLHDKNCLGRSVTEILPKIKDHDFITLFQKIIRTGRAEKKTSTFFQNHQLVFWRDFHFFKLKSGEIVAQCQDITAHKKMEENLRQSQKLEAMGTLAGGIAHDFNNILTSIIGYTEMIQLFGLTDSNALPPRLKEILKAAYRAKDLVYQILTYSRRSSQEKKPVMIKPIVREALKLMRASLPTTIEIQQQIKTKSMVLADPNQMHQVLVNLCANAGQAMQAEGGTLTVNVTETDQRADSQDLPSDLEPGPMIKITVSDTGSGMDHEIVKRIFDPYFTTKRKGQGTGMGLAVVQGIIKSHNGSIAVTSTPGQGTCFEVYLPKTNEKIVKAVKKKLPPPPRGNEHLLFVDDDEVLSCYAREVILKLGYTVTTARNGIEALKIFQEAPQTFDLLITDQTMPKMTGSQLSLEILKIRPDLPIILGTGFAPPQLYEEAKNLGISQLILKPYETHNLWHSVRKILDMTQRTRKQTND